PFHDGDGPPIDRALFEPAVAAREPELHTFFQKALFRADARLGALHRELERRGLAANTVIAVTADHGYGWGEHGYWSYGKGLFDELVHVPLILIWDGFRGGPRHIPLVGGHVDLWPTLADVIGAPPDPAWQGKSLLGPSTARRAY